MRGGGQKTQMTNLLKMSVNRAVHESNIQKNNLGKHTLLKFIVTFRTKSNLNKCNKILICFNETAFVKHYIIS